MALPRDEWGPKCVRCGDDEYRIDGYCSIYCRDMAEVEQECNQLRDVIAGLLDGLDANSDERGGLTNEQWERLIQAARQHLE